MKKVRKSVELSPPPASTSELDGESQDAIKSKTEVDDQSDGGLVDHEKQDEPKGERDNDFDLTMVVSSDKITVPNGHSVRIDDTGTKFVLVNNESSEVVGEYPRDEGSRPAIAEPTQVTPTGSISTNGAVSEIWKHFTRSKDKCWANCVHCPKVYNISSTNIIIMSLELTVDNCRAPDKDLMGSFEEEASNCLFENAKIQRHYGYGSSICWWICINDCEGTFLRP